MLMPWQKKLRSFMCDEQLRQKYAGWGEEYTKDFDVNIVGMKLVDIYRQALLKR